ncbi:hypothetical protein MBLNU13_g09453t2 [Cladosporium sp. NU13]
MDNTNLFPKDSESLLASDREDEELYIPTQRKLARRITITAALTVVNVAVLFATMVLWLSSPRSDGCIPRLAGAGDAQDAIDNHAIEYEVRVYSKPLEYDEVSRKAVIASYGDRNYVGPPSPETDAAWSDLLRGRFIEMTPAEVGPFKPKLKSLLQSGSYIFEPEVFHALHCIDAIRLHVSASMYANITTPRMRQQQSHYDKLEKLSPGIKELHMEHCIDRLREYVMCHADLTPSPLYSYDDWPGVIGKTGPRVCRKWEPIRRWMDSRGAGSKTDGGR